MDSPRRLSRARAVTASPAQPQRARCTGAGRGRGIARAAGAARCDQAADHREGRAVHHPLAEQAGRVRRAARTAARRRSDRRRRHLEPARSREPDPLQGLRAGRARQDHDDRRADRLGRMPRAVGAAHAPARRSPTCSRRCCADRMPAASTDCGSGCSRPSACAAIRPARSSRRSPASTSRCGICSARRSASRCINCSAGKYRPGQPLYRGIGGTTADDLVKNAKAAVDSGMQMVKMSYRKGKGSEDIERVAAVAAFMKPHGQVAVDSLGAFKLYEAVQAGRRFDKLGNVGWFEDALQPDDQPAYPTLAQSLETPVCAGEMLNNRFQFRDLLSAKRRRHHQSGRLPRRRDHRVPADRGAGRRVQRVVEPARQHRHGAVFRRIAAPRAGDAELRDHGRRAQARRAARERARSRRRSASRRASDRAGRARLRRRVGRRGAGACYG